MKKLTAAIIFILFNSVFINTHAQIKIISAQVKEILIHTGGGGLLGGNDAEIKVITKSGKWNSYLINKTSNIRLAGFKSYDSVSHKLIAVLSSAQLNNMLKGIAVIKPTITPSTFNLTAPGLIAELKKGTKTPVSDTPNFEKLVMQKTIDEAIANTVVTVNVMDAFEYCDVDIITYHNDTIKINSRNLCPTMLPWTINNHSTYDMAVNNFILTALGKEDVPNKTSLNISSLKECVYKYIDEVNTGAPIATFKWKHYYPGNLKLLNANFTITETFLYGDVYSCMLKTKTMPTNAFLESRIDMRYKSDIELVIKYANLIDNYLKSNNFVFNYYSNHLDSHIGFSYTTGHSPYMSLKYLDKKLPELSKTDSTKVISFLISAPDDSSNWIMFPDNKVLLTYHSITTSHGETAPIYPAHDPKASWSEISSTYYLFDRNGKVLSEGRGLW